MSPVEIVIVAVLVCSTAYLLVRELQRRRTEAAITPSPARILFPFVGQALSTPAFDAALRLARAEGATLVPVYLAIVPLSVQLDTPLRKQAEAAIPLLEAIEQRATTQGVPVDSRIEPGRSVRHALRLLMEHEHFERLVAAAAANGSDGFSADDVAWMLEHAPGEILILRPSREPVVLPRRPRDERGNDRVRRVLLRVPEDSENKAPVG